MASFIKEVCLVLEHCCIEEKEEDAAASVYFVYCKLRRLEFCKVVAVCKSK